MAEASHTFARKKLYGRLSRTDPGFRKGHRAVRLRHQRGRRALPRGADGVGPLEQVVHQCRLLLTAWPRRGLAALVQNTAGFTRLHAVDQKNRNLLVILNKAKGMVNRKFVRAVIIEGLSEPDQEGWRLLNKRARDSDIPIILLKVS